jgi:hypothetical protein
MDSAGQGGLQRWVSGTDRPRDYAKHDLQRGNYIDNSDRATVQHRFGGGRR